jgi:HD-GYP domain-containing protein (c-di-GMP phosphodiesterase class II)
MEDSGSPARIRRPIVSIRFVIMLAAVALISISVAAVGWIAERNSRLALTNEIESRLLVEARNLALLSTEALLSEFPELTLYPVVSEMEARRDDLAFVVVVDHEGVIQGHVEVRKLGQRLELPESFVPTRTRQQLKPRESLFANDEVIVASVPVSFAQDRDLGRAIVGLRRAYVNGIVMHSRREIIFFSAALLLAGVLSTLVLMSTLLRPIAALRQGLERIGRGDLDTPMRLRDRTEIGLLGETVNEMASQIKADRQEIIDTQREVIQRLGAVVERRSKETANHIVRVGLCARRLAILAGLGEEEADLVLMASPMHDVGKVGIPDAILNKPGRLTPAEFDAIKTHPAIGHELLRSSEREIMKASAVIAYHHHERWDGEGYPQGLKEEEIHIYGRIVAVVDVFDALRSERTYKRAMPVEEVVEYYQTQRGRHFDPRLADLFLEHLDDFLAIHGEYADHVITPTEDTTAKAA